VRSSDHSAERRLSFSYCNVYIAHVFNQSLRGSDSEAKCVLLLQCLKLALQASCVQQCALVARGVTQSRALAATLTLSLQLQHSSRNQLHIGQGPFPFDPKLARGLGQAGTHLRTDAATSQTPPVSTAETLAVLACTPLQATGSPARLNCSSITTKVCLMAEETHIALDSVPHHCHIGTCYWQLPASLQRIKYNYQMGTACTLQLPVLQTHSWNRQVHGCALPHLPCRLLVPTILCLQPEGRPDQGLPGCQAESHSVSSQNSRVFSWSVVTTSSCGMALRASDSAAAAAGPWPRWAKARYRRAGRSESMSKSSTLGALRKICSRSSRDAARSSCGYQKENHQLIPWIC
jgi:hypothetical protein